MFQDTYVKLDKNETKDVVAHLNPVFDGGDFDVNSTVVMARKLPFYKNSRFLDIADHRTMPPSRRYVVTIDDKATILDFTNAPIYKLNATVPISLSQSNIADYAKFFFSFVKGRHGRFIVVEGVDDIPWREEPPPAARKAVGKMISPIALIEADNNVYRLNVNMMFKDSLFQATAEISPDGQVTLLNETLLVEDIPVIDDLLGQ